MRPPLPPALSWQELLLLLLLLGSAAALRRGDAVIPHDPNEEGPDVVVGTTTDERFLMELLHAHSRAGHTSPAQKVRLLTGSKTEVLDVVVIGAGWAGLGAARILDQKGLNFVVLEARDYIGGRSRTVGLNGTLVELGSQWIEGMSLRNPMYALARDMQAPMLESGLENGGYWSSSADQSAAPRRMSDSEYNSMYQELYEDGWFPFMVKRQDSTDTDASLRSTTDLYIQQKGLSAHDERALEMLLEENVVQEYGASLQDLSTWWWDSDSEMGGGDGILMDGYGSLVDHYARTLLDRIYTNAPVSRIDYTNDIVTVNYQYRGVNSTLQSYSVIVTVPLGVLQSQAITFEPPLPSWKQNSIDKLGMGLLNKLIMEWDDTTALPWPAAVEWLERMATPQGRWTEFYNYRPMTGRNLLVAFAAGREAARVENLTDAAVLAEALAALGVMFNATPVPAPRSYLVTRWRSDPHARGAYSYYPPGSRPRDREHLAAAVDGRLFFAGEACHRDYPSTTHGALMSGLAAGAAAARGSGGGASGGSGRATASAGWCRLLPALWSAGPVLAAVLDLL